MPARMASSRYVISCSAHSIRNLADLAPFHFAMFDHTDTNSTADIDISRHEVSEDGVTWRPYDPARDSSELLHTRIVFGDPQDD
jgi:hypothetical protein